MHFCATARIYTIFKALSSLLCIKKQVLRLEHLFEVKRDSRSSPSSEDRLAGMTTRSFQLLVQESENHARTEVLTSGVLECRAVEEREELVHIDLVALGNGAECLREGGEIARELRADTGVGEECTLLLEFLVHLVGGGCAEAELCNESFRVEATRTVESFRCCKPCS